MTIFSIFLLVAPMLLGHVLIAHALLAG